MIFNMFPTEFQWIKHLGGERCAGHGSFRMDMSAESSHTISEDLGTMWSPRTRKIGSNNSDGDARVSSTSALGQGHWVFQWWCFGFWRCICTTFFIVKMLTLWEKQLHEVCEVRSLKQDEPWCEVNVYHYGAAMSVYERLKSWEEALDLLFFMRQQLASRCYWQNVVLVGRWIELNSCGITLFRDFEAIHFPIMLTECPSKYLKGSGGVFFRGS